MVIKLIIMLTILLIYIIGCVILYFFLGYINDNSDNSDKISIGVIFLSWLGIIICIFIFFFILIAELKPPTLKWMKKNGKANN